MADRRGRSTGARQYPRTARVNQVLREVLAEALEGLLDKDPRLGMLTITAVRVEPDFRHATVLFSSLPQAAEEALVEHRVALQASIGRQVRLKRTPQLAFEADPAVASGQRVEDILRGLGDSGEHDAGD